MHPALQFLTFIGVLFGALVTGTVIGLGIVWVAYGAKTIGGIMALDPNVPHFITAIWILQFAGTTLPILAVPVFFAYVVVNDPHEYLRATPRFAWLLMVVVFAVMIASSPLIEFLTNLNQKIPVPHFLQWMVDNAVKEEKVMTAMMDMKTLWDAIYNVLFIGLLTAVVEELMFRGCLQTIFEKWTKNIHVAIWITAILFSAFHMDFYGFLPRVLLGAMFGYFVAWSDSVWPAVWAHFLNNSTIVVVNYLYQQKLIKLNPDDNHVFNNAGYSISLLIVLFLFWVYYYIATNKKPAVA